MKIAALRAACLNFLACGAPLEIAALWAARLDF